MDDYNVSTITNALTLLPNLKYLDVTGNKITVTGEGFLVKALQNPVVKDIMITIKKYSAELGQKVIKPALKLFIQHAKDNGVDTTDVAINKNAFQYMSDMSKIKDNFLIGFTKCESGYAYLESGVTVEDLAVEGSLIGLKALTKKALSPLVCIITAPYEAFVTPEGAGLAIKFVDLIGDSE